MTEQMWQSELERQTAVDFLRLVNASAGTRELIEFATRFFQEQSGCEAVGIRLRDGDDYPYYEARGFSQEFLLVENSLCVRSECGEPQFDGDGNPVLECMCGNVIRGRFDPTKPFFTAAGSFWTNGTTELLASTTEADRQARTRNRCNGEGHESVALIRLQSGSEPLGLLQLNDHRKGAFTAETIIFWERLAGYLAVALAKSRAEEKLRESEAELRGFFESPGIMRGIVAVVGRDILHLSDNASSAAFFGRSQESMRGKFASEMGVPENVVRMWIEHYEESKRAGHPVRFEYRHASPDSENWLLVTVSFLNAAPEGYSRYVYVVMDITDLKRTEQALRETQDRLALAANAAQMGMFDWDVRTGEVAWTQQHEAIFGYATTTTTTTQHTYRDWADRVHPDDLPWVEQKIRRCMAERTLYQVEYRILWPDGSLHWVASQGRAYYGAEGAAIRMLGTVMDITERKQAEDKLRISEARFREAQEVASLGSYVFDMFSGHWTSSEVLDRIFDIPQDYIKTIEGWANLLHPEDRQPMVDYLCEDALSRHIPFDREYRIIRYSDKQVRWVHGLGRVELDATGNPHVFLGTIQDITERKRLEQEKLEMERRLLHAQKLESLGILAGGIAHDFNNILAGVLGYADLALLQLPDMAEVHKSLAEIKKASQRAAELTRQMLAYSGKGKFLIEPLSLSHVVEESRKFLAMSVSKKAILTYDLADDLPTIIADKAQMGQVLMNLVINASEALGAQGGRIHVITKAVTHDTQSLAAMKLDQSLPEGPYVCLEVADTGCGMDKQTLERIFDPFFTTKFTGRGLGLAAVHGIVRGHEGAIHLTSELGRGTTFRVLFPASDLPAPVVSSKCASAPWRGNGTVLVVDDEEVIRSVTRQMIEHVGCSVLTATGGRDAVRLFNERHTEVDCVLLDLSMPDLDGVETLLQLRDIRDDIPVILSSGYGEQAAMERFADQGLSGFLQKPYRFDVLAAKLREVLENGPQTDSGSHRFANDKHSANDKRTVSDKPATGDTVLVVDDEEISRSVTKLMFELEGFSTLTAEDGEEAVRLYGEHRDQIVCVFLDLNLPGMNGEETLGALRQIDAGVRFILASGGDTAAAAERCAGPGLVGYIEKPEPLDAVIAKLRGALGKASVGSSQRQDR